MEKTLRLGECNALVLAYMGDAVIELFTRQYLIGDGNCRISELNERAKNFVTAVSQSAAVERVLPFLTEGETAVFKHGRNAKGIHVPKSAAAIEYRRATGLECLFGHLYLEGNEKRARELFKIAYSLESDEAVQVE